MIDASKLIHWNYNKNELSPENFSNGSSRTVHWICEHNHEWSTTIKNKKGCPYCAGKLVGYGNDLLSVHPQALNEWHPTKNDDLKPQDFTAGSKTIVWWKCSHGHEWQARVKRFNEGTGCPFCSTRMTDSTQSIQSIKPSFFSEFDHKKNTINPDSLSVGSEHKVWWKCAKGHSWETSVKVRNKGSGCPHCKLSGTSKPELFLFDQLKKLYPSAIHRYKSSFGELDIFIPELNVAVEYDGFRWHKTKLEKDISKFNSAKNNNITLINIREESLPLFNESNIQSNYPRSEYALQELLQKVLFKINSI